MPLETYWPPSPFLQKAVVLKLQHGGESERIVGTGQVYLIRTHSGVRPQDVLGVVTGDRRDRSVLVVHIDSRLAAAPDHGADLHQWLLEILGVFGTADDDAGGIIGLHAAVEQMQWFADDTRVHDILDRVTGLVIGFWIIGGVLAVRNLDVRDLFWGRAVIVHMAQESRGEHLTCTLPAVRPHMDLVTNDWRCRACSSAANPHLRVAVHRTKDRDRLAHAGLDHPHGDTNQRLGTGATAMHVHIEIQSDAKITGHKRREGRVVAQSTTACRRCPTLQDQHPQEHY